MEDLIVIGFEYADYDNGGYGTDTQRRRVLADCTNGFLVSNDETSTTNYALSAFRVQDCVASDIACAGSGFTSTTRSGKGFDIVGLNVLHCSAILDGFVTSKHATGIVTNSYCSLINCTGTGTATGIEINGTDVIVQGGYYKGTNSYGVTTKAGSSYAINGVTMDGGTNDIYIQSGSGYGTLTNFVAVNSSVAAADAAALLKCVISNPRQATTPTTFTPSPKLGGGNTGMTFTTCTGAYLINGNVVTGSIYLLWSALGSSTGALTIEGLPLTSSAVTGARGGGSATAYTGVTMGANQAGIVGTISPSATAMSMYFTPTAGGVATTNVLHGDLSATTSLVINFTYMIDR
jgi:hypothetical protein